MYTYKHTHTYIYIYIYIYIYSNHHYKHTFWHQEYSNLLKTNHTMNFYFLNTFLFFLHPYCALNYHFKGKWVMTHDKGPLKP